MSILRKANLGFISVFATVFVLGLMTILAPNALSQTYPTKPIRIIVPQGTGGSPDTIARLIGAKLSEALGQQIIIDNRVGAGGRIGTEIASRAVPDGYTLLLTSSQLAIVSGMFDNLKYDLVKDFSPISLLGSTSAILVVNPSIPVNSVKELIALAKSRPGALKYASGGTGSTPHLAAEVFKFMTGTDILHVPYKEATPSLASTMSGEVDLYFAMIAPSLPLIKSGRLRALGITKRTTLIPDLPSISETVPGYEFVLWQGLVAPAKTPPAILSKLNTEVIKVLNTAAVRERMAAIGNEPIGCSQQEFALFLSEQMARMKEAVKLSGARPEN
jgi:tripartite-type tricarboxylate transporter receptor subunit TctC